MLRGVPPAFLFAPGAGAPSTSPWMQRFAAHLSRTGPVTTFDYPYRKAGRRAPDRLPVLVEAHREAYQALERAHAGPIVLAGKSMGSRVGCHLARDVTGVAALVCFGYPLRGASPRAPLRDAVLRGLTTPIFFAQGTRDKLCPIDELEAISRFIAAPFRIHRVETGDHSLEITKAFTKSTGKTQHDCEVDLFEALTSFLSDVLGPGV